MTFSGAGLLSGTPSAAGTFTQSVTVKDSTGSTASSSLTLSVAVSVAPLAVSTTSLPPATAGKNYSATITASGGTAPYTWSGTGVDGLTFSGAGLLSGAPSAAGTFTQSVTVKDSTGTTASSSLTLSVAVSVAPLAVSTTSLPSATAGKSYSVTITASGGTAPYTWSGAGVDGLTFSGAGLLSGTPSAAGIFTQSVTVKDSTGSTASASLTLTVTSVSGGGTSITLIQHTSKDAGTTSSSTLTFHSNNSASNWVAVSIRAGAANEIFTVTDTNGNTYRKAIQFTQTVDGDTIGIFYAENIAGGANTVTVSDTAVATLRFAILEYSGVATSGSLDVVAAAQGSNASPNSGSVTTTANGDLLLGTIMTADPETYTAGIGDPIEESVPAEPGTKLITEDQVQATAGAAAASATLGGADAWAAGIAAFKVAGSGGGTAPTITSASSTMFTVGTAGSFAVTTGGTPLPSLSESGTLPTGVTFKDNGNGSATLSGPPASGSGGTYALTLAATNGIGTPMLQAFSLTVESAPLAVSTTQLPAATAGTAYSATIAASGGTGPYTWSGTGVDGLTFSGAGLLSGTPSAAGTFTQSVTVKDSTGTTASSSLTLSVAASVAPLAVSTTQLPAATAGTAYSATITASGGTAPYTWSGSGVDGLTFSGTGLLSGTPSAAGTFAQSVMVKDSTGTTASASLTLSVAVPVAPLAVSTTQLPAATAGTAYSATITASGGTAPYTWSGTGVDGLTFSGAGLLSGTPSAAGTFTQSVTVKDSTGATASASLTLSVAVPVAPLAVSTTSLPSATAGKSYSATITASGGTAPYTWSGTGVDSLTFSGAGLLSGTPSAAGTFTQSVTVKDSTGAAASASLTLSVAVPVAPLAVSTTSLPSATAGKSYSATLTASGGTAPYTWSGTGVDGLTFSGAGLLSGTPSAAGTFTQSVTVKDSTGATASASLTLSVAVPVAPLAVSTTSLPSATAGTAYSATITASGGTAPYTWSGTGVDGLTFSGAGLLSGTPSAAGTFTQSVTVKDSTGVTASASLALTVTSSSGGGTSITLIQHTSKDAGTTSSSKLKFHSNNSASNWVAVSIRAGAANEIFTVRDTNGNTYRKAIQFTQTVDGDTIGIFYAENIAGGANTVTVSDTAVATLRFAILEYSGVATSGSLDVVAMAQGSNASPNSGSVTTTANGDLLLGTIMTADPETYTAGIGDPIEESVPAEPGTKLITEDQVQATAGAAAASATLGAANAWAAGIAAFRASQ